MEFNTLNNLEVSSIPTVAVDKVLKSNSKKTVFMLLIVRYRFFLADADCFDISLNRSPICAAVFLGAFLEGDIAFSPTSYMIKMTQ